MATPVPGQSVDLGVYDRFHVPHLALGSSRKWMDGPCFDLVFGVGMFFFPLFFRGLQRDTNKNIIFF